MRVLLRGHPAAQTAAELDRPPRFVPEEVLDEERHAAEGTGAERLLVERIDAIRIRLDDGVDGGIDGGDRCGGGLRELFRRHLSGRHELGEPDRIEARVLGKVHQGLGAPRARCRWSSPAALTLLIVVQTSSATRASA